MLRSSAPCHDVPGPEASPGRLRQRVAEIIKGGGENNAMGETRTLDSAFPGGRNSISKTGLSWWPTITK